MQIITDFTPELLHAWNRLSLQNTLHVPFLTSTWHMLSSSHFQQIPWIVKTNDVIIPLTRINDTLMFSGNEEIADYLDAIGNEQQKASVWQETITAAQTQGITKCILHNIPDGSQTISFFRSLQKNHPTSILIEQEDTTPSMLLPHDWDTYLAQLSRKDRHELKRKIKKFEFDHPEVSCIEETDLKKSMEDLLELMTLQPEKKTFLTPKMTEFFRNVPVSFADTVSFLTLKTTKTIASIVFFVQNNSLFLYNSGFNEIAYTGSGFYLKAMSIKKAIQKNLTVYNFLQGNERYKYDLGGKDSPVWKVTMSL